MIRPRLRTWRRPALHRDLQDRLDPQPFATSDHVLLCCFGLDLSAERSSSQLRKALIEAGFGLSEAREVLRGSPLVYRTSVGSYRLRSVSRPCPASKKRSRRWTGSHPREGAGSSPE
jgi:hypothetical protein